MSGQPLPPSARGAEKCLLAAAERYSLFAFNSGAEDGDDWRLDNVPRYDLLAQVARACGLFDTVLVERGKANPPRP